MKKIRMSTGCLVLLICSNLAFGAYVGIDRPEPREEVGLEDVLVAPEPGWSKSENGFSATLLLTDEPDDVLRTWTSPSAGVAFQAADTITRGAAIVAFVFFSGCEADKHGMCNASADFTILRPDGSEYESFADRDLWKGKPAPPKGMLRLSAEYVGVVIEPGDPLGEYEVQVSVHDLNTGTTLDLTLPFTAIDGNR
jgi:hypothetical protein